MIEAGPEEELSAIEQVRDEEPVNRDAFDLPAFENPYDREFVEAEGAVKVREQDSETPQQADGRPYDQARPDAFNELYFDSGSIRLRSPCSIYWIYPSVLIASTVWRSRGISRD